MNTLKLKRILVLSSIIISGNSLAKEQECLNLPEIANGFLQKNPGAVATLEVRDLKINSTKPVSPEFEHFVFIETNNNSHYVERTPPETEKMVSSIKQDGCTFLHANNLYSEQDRNVRTPEADFPIIGFTKDKLFLRRDTASGSEISSIEVISEDLGVNAFPLLSLDKNSLTLRRIDYKTVTTSIRCETGEVVVLESHPIESETYIVLGKNAIIYGPTRHMSQKIQENIPLFFSLLDKRQRYYEKCNKQKTRFDGDFKILPKADEGGSSNGGGAVSEQDLRKSNKGL